MIWFVGEAPSRTSDPSDPLSSLRRKLGFLPADFSHVELVNLLDRWPGSAGKGLKFSPRAAAKAARKLGAEFMAGDFIVMFGKRVARAFGVRSGYLEWSYLPCGARACVAPHPSGVNRWWNDPENKRLAADFLLRTALRARLEPKRPRKAACDMFLPENAGSSTRA